MLIFFKYVKYYDLQIAKPNKFKHFSIQCQLVRDACVAKGNVSFLYCSPGKWSRAAVHKFLDVFPVTVANVVKNGKIVK